ncbi:hypothetical protein NPIL_171441, partial [Nephila pilipes]
MHAHPCSVATQRLNIRRGASLRIDSTEDRRSLVKR